jgi:hypothetical protein
VAAAAEVRKKKGYVEEKEGGLLMGLYFDPSSSFHKIYRSPPPTNT